MTGKHAAPGGSKKPLVIILIIVLAAALFGAGVFVALNFFNKDKPGDTGSTQPTVSTVATAPATTAPLATTATAPSVAPTSEAPMGTEATPTIGEPIQIPTHGGAVSTFNATYVPGSAEDMATGNAVTLRDALGSDFRSATLTFNEDGTYVCNLGGLGTTTGMYVVEDGVLTATDTTDRNMNITVTEWNESTGAPASFYVIIGEETAGVKLTFAES